MSSIIARKTYSIFNFDYFLEIIFLSRSEIGNLESSLKLDRRNRVDNGCMRGEGYKSQRKAIQILLKTVKHI